MTRKKKEPTIRKNLRAFFYEKTEKIKELNQSLLEIFERFEKAYFDSLQEKFEMVNPWVGNLVRTKFTFHGYMFKVFEQLKQGEELLSKREDFNSYQQKIIEFSGFEGFSQAKVKTSEENLLASQGQKLVNFESNWQGKSREEKSDNKRVQKLANKQGDSAFMFKMGKILSANYKKITDEPDSEFPSNLKKEPKKATCLKSYQNLEKCDSSPFDELSPNENPKADEKKIALSLKPKTFGDLQFAEAQNLQFKSNKQTQESDFLAFSAPQIKQAGPIFSEQDKPILAKEEAQNLNIFGLPKKTASVRPQIQLTIPKNDSEKMDFLNPASENKMPNSNSKGAFGIFANNEIKGPGGDGPSLQPFYTPNLRSQTFEQISGFGAKSQKKDDLLNLDFDPSRKNSSK